MQVFRDVGLFWLGEDDQLPPSTPPQGCVAGGLEGADDGRITLDLSGRLSPADESGLFLGTEDNPPRTLRGILKSNGEHVLLTGARPIEARYTEQISSEIMRANAALLSSHPITLGQFTDLTMPRAGFEARTHPGSVAAERPEGEDGA
mgnify:CR=1 FL=1